MIIHEMEQNTPEWYKIRLGIPTASCFDQIVCPPDYREKYDCGGGKCTISHTAENAAKKCKSGTGQATKYIDQSIKVSASYHSYMNKLLAEWLGGTHFESYESDWIKRGHELEAEARELYEFATDTPVRQVGFVTNDTETVGCSPDGIGLEIKCPAPQTHIKYLLNKKCPQEYVGQVQGSMWICEADSWDFMSYHPDLPCLILRVERDEEYIAGLSAEIQKFLEKMDSKKSLLEAA